MLNSHAGVGGWGGGTVVVVVVINSIMLVAMAALGRFERHNSVSAEQARAARCCVLRSLISVGFVNGCGLVCLLFSRGNSAVS